MKKQGNRICQSRVFVTHGVTGNFSSNNLTQRGLLEDERLDDYLRMRRSPYVDLASALAGNGDALTIDDATKAAYDAAVMAQRHSHEVTLFINPYNIIQCQPYYFAQLSVVLDRARISQVNFLNEPFSLESPGKKQILRDRVKQKLMTLNTEDERVSLIQDLTTVLQVEDISLPQFLRTMNLNELYDLMKIGVRIGNHGWTHAAIEALPPICLEWEIIQARQWIEHTLGCSADMYAVPFGHSLPRFRFRPQLCRFWFLNNGFLKSGMMGAGIFNRSTLRL